jgi:hypothetical protein
MAKAHLGYLKTEHDTNFWHSLFDDLKKRVLANKIACPESAFHRAETMYDTSLEDAIRCAIDKLSWGLKFRPREDILESQIEEAAFKFLGKNPPASAPWSIAFESDPQAPVESRMQDIGGIEGRVNVHLSLSNEIVEHDRQLKSKYAKDEELLAKLDNVCHDWHDEVLMQKMSLIKSIFLDDQATRSNEKQRHLIRLWGKLGEIGVKASDTTTAANFLASEELRNIPYIDIFSSIEAAIALHYPTRKCKGSDSYDIPILATVLPYCDIVTTDSFMKEIVVKTLRFDDKYKAKIFSAKKADRLAFQKIIQEL